MYKYENLEHTPEGVKQLRVVVFFWIILYISRFPRLACALSAHIIELPHLFRISTTVHQPNFRPVIMDPVREKALQDYRKKLLEHAEVEGRLKESNNNSYFFQCSQAYM